MISGQEKPACLPHLHPFFSVTEILWYIMLVYIVWRCGADWQEEDKLRLAARTGLDPKQINNWFINQRKRHWKPSDGMRFALMEGVAGGSSGTTLYFDTGTIGPWIHFWAMPPLEKIGHLGSNSRTWYLVVIVSSYDQSFSRSVLFSSG